MYIAKLTSNMCYPMLGNTNLGSKKLKKKKFFVTPPKLKNGLFKQKKISQSYFLWI